MSQTKAKPLMRYVVLDFICDHCGLTIDMILLTKPGTQKRFAGSLHKECFAQQMKPGQEFHNRGAN